jgi:hypothetical protein
MELDCHSLLVYGGTVVGVATPAVVWLARAFAKCLDGRDHDLEREHQVVDRLLNRLGL